MNAFDIVYNGRKFKVNVGKSSMMLFDGYREVG